MIATVMSMLVLVASAAADDVLSHARLEKMLADGDKEMISQVFQRNADDVLAFIDEYLEGGLKMIETSKDDAGALKSFRTGIEFARIADTAFAGKTYTTYAASFASWSPGEQKMFREGQAEFKAGREATQASQPAAAMEHYERSLAKARKLNDLWGLAMSYVAVTETQLKLEQFDKVQDSAQIANQYCTQLGLRLDQVNLMIAWGDASAATSARGFGANHYQYAFQLLQEDDDGAIRQKILDRWVASLERAGQPEAAAEIRKKYGMPDPEPSAKPAASP